MILEKQLKAQEFQPQGKLVVLTLTAGFKLRYRRAFGLSSGPPSRWHHGGN